MRRQFAAGCLWVCLVGWLIRGPPGRCESSSTRRPAPRLVDLASPRAWWGSRWVPRAVPRRPTTWPPSRWSRRAGPTISISWRGALASAFPAIPCESDVTDARSSFRDDEFGDARPGEEGRVELDRGRAGVACEMHLSAAL